MDVDPDLLANPTRCFVAGCSAENEILLHLQVDPAGFADLCWEHAIEVSLTNPTLLTCSCFFCQRARDRLLGVKSGAADD